MSDMLHTCSTLKCSVTKSNFISFIQHKAIGTTAIQ